MEEQNEEEIATMSRDSGIQKLGTREVLLEYRNLKHGRYSTGIK